MLSIEAFVMKGTVHIVEVHSRGQFSRSPAFLASTEWETFYHMIREQHQQAKQKQRYQLWSLRQPRSKGDESSEVASGCARSAKILRSDRTSCNASYFRRRVPHCRSNPRSTLRLCNTSLCHQKIGLHRAVAASLLRTNHLFRDQNEVLIQKCVLVFDNFKQQ